MLIADKIAEISMGLSVYSSPALLPHQLPRLEPRTLSASASANLDLIRGLAAWAVMWGHLRALFFVDFQQLQNSSPFLNVLYFITGFGHEAVMVFFVLSGFFISTAIITRHASGKWSWRDYAIDRSSRLYVVLVPALLLGWLSDKVGSYIFAYTGLYSKPLEGFGDAIALNRITPGIFFGNLLFLQTIVCPTFGSNGPLWSLANEFWYYVIFPIALSAGLAWRARATRTAISLTILVVCLAIFLELEIFLGFLVWLVGVILVLAYSNFAFRGKKRILPYCLASSFLLFSCLVAARTGNSAVLASDLSLGIAFGLFLFGVIQMDFGTNRSLYPRVAHLMAGFSYSLYVLHFPLLLFLRAWLVPQQRWQPDAKHLAYGTIVGAIILCFAWLISTFTESKTHIARRWMRTMIPRFDGRSN
jgi:peptidoglycan/LPS O-acetylase OafA/YrhL